MAKSKTTCRVLFEDYRGDAHRVTVRVPYSARITNSNIAKLAAQKSGHRVSLIVGMECADSGVTCNAICPGWVLTPLVQKQIEDHAKEQGIPVDKAKENLLKEKQPMLQFSTPEHLGALTVFLCGDTACTITGTTVSMDGGWTAQ